MGLAGAISMALAGINLRIRSRPLHPSPFLRCSTSSCSGIRSSPSSSWYLRRSNRLTCIKSVKVSGCGSALREESREREEDMTVKKGACISDDRSLVIEGRTVLTEVPPEVTATPDAGGAGLFLGVKLPNSSDRHVVSLGKLRNIRFLACFRFKLWWMAQKMGQSGDEVPLETQFLLLELPSSSSSTTLYVAILPLLDALFRASLRGSADSSLLLSLESGNPSTTSSSSPCSLLLGPALPDPFAAVSAAVSDARRHLGTFRLRIEKPLPPIVDLLGWCTWDAFYQDVSQSGVEDGLRSFASSGIPLGFVIIDDGWQTVAPDPSSDQKPSPLMRLTKVEENHKFKSENAGIGHIVSVAKRDYGVKYVYTWHAILGYWGGVGSTVEGSELRYPVVCEGVDGNEPGLKGDAMMVEGVGVVNPQSVFGFYDELHGYLAREGVDGVKVDVQSVLETLGGGLGGRVELAKVYHEALDRSVAKHFAGTGIIACMSHSSDAVYCAKQTAVVRASDDFYPRDPVSHTIHIASVSYNSIFLGEFMLPDWDMFHSLHPAADYHASARAISGGPVYVSDAPGKHDFDLLRKLVLPDGSILRARLPGRPTRDCLFTDPTRDGISLLKIWNMNNHTGVLGVYNCQGAAWSSTVKKNVSHPNGTDALTCSVKGDDVHLIYEAANDTDWNGDCALYQHGVGELVVLPQGVALPVSLKVLEHSIFTVTPIKVLAPGFMFAPFGLIEMYNGGGAIENLAHQVNMEKSYIEYGDSIVGDSIGAGLLENKSLDPVGFVHIDVKGCGTFGAFSSTKPRRCLIDLKDTEFLYDSASGLLKFNLEKMPENHKKVHTVVVEL